MQQAVNDYNVINITGGTYIISDTIIVPPRRTLTGGTFKIVGQPSGAVLESDPDYWNAFEFQPGHDVIIRDVTFVGENDPFDGQFVQNLCRVLDFPHGGTYRNIIVERCRFENLYGFPMAGSVACDSCLVANNYAESCGNGFNINAPNTIYLRNTLINAEGIETAGDNGLIADNTLIGGIGGIGIGGQTTPGAYVTGQIVRNNTISNTGTGIALKEMCRDSIIEDNIISNVNYGIVVAPTWNGTWTEDCTIRRNTIDTVIQSTPGVGGVGLLIRLDARRTAVQDNTITNAISGVQLWSPSTQTTLQNNFLRGSSVDLFIDAAIEDTTLIDNDYLTCSGCD